MEPLHRLELGDRQGRVREAGEDVRILPDILRDTHAAELEVGGAAEDLDRVGQGRARRGEAPGERRAREGHLQAPGQDRGVALDSFRVRGARYAGGGADHGSSRGIPEELPPVVHVELREVAERLASLELLVQHLHERQVVACERAELERALEPGDRVL